jgi:hypothetical protein
MCRHTLRSWCGWSDPSLGLCNVVTNWWKVYIGLLLPPVLARGRRILGSSSFWNDISMVRLHGWKAGHLMPVLGLRWTLVLSLWQNACTIWSERPSNLISISAISAERYCEAAFGTYPIRTSSIYAPLLRQRYTKATVLRLP